MSVKTRSGEDATTRRPVYEWLAFILLIVSAGIWGCTKLEEGPTGEPGPTEFPEQELFDATINFYQNDRLTGILEAGRIRKYAKRSTVLLDSGVVMEFYNAEGQHTSTLTSDSGRADESRNDMIAMGHVVAHSDSGEMLETQQLRWENRTRKIISDVPVKLSTPTDTIFGVGFISDENLKNWQIREPTGQTFREFEKREQQPYLSLPDTAVQADSG